MRLEAFIACLLLAAPAVAAPPKPQKPQVCLSWDIYTHGASSVAVCKDGPKAKTFIEYGFVTIEATTYLVGVQ